MPVFRSSLAATGTIAATLAVALAAMLAVAPAFAHVTLAPKQAEIGSRHEFVLRVPHGCKGSPTIGLRVRIPDGVLEVRARAQPGWKLETVEGAYDKPYALDGAKLVSGVKEMSWSGGPLPDKQVAEFGFSAWLSAGLAANTRLLFPAVQECEQGVTRWIDTPAEGSKPAADHSGTPAPGVWLLPDRK